MNLGGEGLLKGKNMSERFTSSFILFIVIPFMVMSIAVNMLYEKVLVSHYNDIVSQIMEQLSTDLETELKRISLDAAKVSNEGELLSLIDNWGMATNNVKKFEYSKKIDSKLDYLFSYQGATKQLYKI